MGVFTKHVFTGSDGGRPIVIGTSSTPVHTVPSGRTDEVFLYAYNNDSVQRDLTVLWGGATAADEISLGVPPKSGLTLVIPGVALDADKPLAARASAGGVITLTGYVNRINP